MPLTLNCVCPDENIAVCELTSLTLVVDVTVALVGSPTISANHLLTFYADKSDPMAATVIMSDPSAGEYTFDLPLIDWAAKWNTFLVELVTNSGSLQVPSPAFSAYDKFWATYYIKQDYACTNPADPLGTTHPFDKAYTEDPQDDKRCEPALGDVRTLCYAGHGVGSLFYKSTIFSSCFGCTITDRDFEPAVTDAGKVDITTGTWCICASGGSGNYSYGLSKGQLPSGMKMDGATGCINGKPDGKAAGTKELTFTVVDLTTHDTAEVVCGILGLTCPGGPDFGNQAY